MAGWARKYLNSEGKQPIERKKNRREEVTREREERERERDRKKELMKNNNGRRDSNGEKIRSKL